MTSQSVNAYRYWHEYEYEYECMYIIQYLIYDHINQLANNLKLIYTYKNMDNNQTWSIKGRTAQQMENWKKLILLDSVLNALFDKNITGQQFYNQKINPLTNTHIATLYSKLSSINFQLLQSIQKQVQNKTTLIQSSYKQFLSYKQQQSWQTQKQKQKSSHARIKPQQNLNFLRNFNKKYENVEQMLTLWRNIGISIHFAKAVQMFRVNCNLLKTIMKGYNGSEDTINPIKIAKMLKQVIYLSTNFNFEGMKFFQSERVFISSTKSIIHSIGCNSLPKLLHQHIDLTLTLADEKTDLSTKIKKLQLQKSLQDWINAFNSIGTLKQFVVNFGKSLFQQLAQHIKKYIKNDLVNIANHLENALFAFISETSKALILLQEKLTVSRKIELTNVPNLFVKFWEKLCEFMRETIMWIKKDQQSRNIPKTRQQAIVWKYPAFYHNFSKLCTQIQVYLLSSTMYNGYNLAKHKQRLMINCLHQLSIQYHQQKQKHLSQISKTLKKISSKNRTNISTNFAKIEQKQQDNQIRTAFNNIQLLFAQARCQQIYDSLLNGLCGKIAQVCHKQRDDGKTGQQMKENGDIEEGFDGKLVNKVKLEAKNIIRKHGEKYGISKKQLQSFKIQN